MNCVVSGVCNDVRVDGKERSVQQPCKTLKFENFSVIVLLLFLACRHKCTAHVRRLQKRMRMTKKLVTRI